MPVSNIRVTSVWRRTQRHVVFSGVLLQDNCYKTLSARTIAVITAQVSQLVVMPSAGQHWRISGEFIEKDVIYDTYSITQQHWFNPFELNLILPEDGESFVTFIAKDRDFKGIGSVKARELWFRFGKTIFSIIESNNIDALKELLSNSAIENLINGFSKYEILKFSSWLTDHKIPISVQHKLFKFHKNKSIETIQDNPYCLVTFGMTFKVVDSLAKKYFSIEVNDKKRLIACVQVALQSQSHHGNTIAYRPEIEAYIQRLLKSKALTREAIEHAQNSQVVRYNVENECFHHTSLLIIEKVISKRLSLLNSKVDEWATCHDSALSHSTSNSIHTLSTQQIKAVTTSLLSHVSCITGGAGTGKTTVIRAVLRACDYLKFEIKAIALSGRAAMRLRESIGFYTTTIAKFLREPRIDNENTILVIDEASMIDIGTMYRIITHIHPSVRLLFVGDPNQLPPIGPGLVLADIVKSGVIRNTELDIVKRQALSTGIPEYSRLVCQGLAPDQLSIANIYFHETSVSDIPCVCQKLYAQNTLDCRVVAPTRLMASNINKLCQEKLNPHADRLIFNEYGENFVLDLKINDPVLFTQNDYEAGVQNGTLGKLISIDRIEDCFGIVRLDDTGEDVEITRSLIDSLVLGYAITLHKAQGSQFKRVIIALSDSRMIDRSWLYTAITRAETELHIVGSANTMYQAIEKLGAQQQRKTYLATLLQQ